MWRIKRRAILASMIAVYPIKRLRPACAAVVCVGLAPLPGRSPLQGHMKKLVSHHSKFIGKNGNKLENNIFAFTFKDGKDKTKR